MHRAKPILNKFYEYMETLRVTNNYSILRGKLEIPKTYPCIVILMGADQSELFNINTTRQKLSVFIDIYNSSTSADLDGEILDIRELVHNLIMNDAKHGFDYVFGTEFIGQDAPDYVGAGQDYAASTRLEFVVTYLSEINTQTI
jgi:hypothetical protein